MEEKAGLVKILKVTLSDHFGNIQGNPCRIIAIPIKSTLYKLASVIIESFNFDFDHAFGFFNNPKNIYKSTEGYELFADVGEETEFGSVKKTKIDQVFDTPKKRMCFMFDYGDDWRFLVEFINDQNVDDIKKYPKIIDSKGKAPEQYPDYDNEK